MFLTRLLNSDGRCTTFVLRLVNPWAGGMTFITLLNVDVCCKTSVTRLLNFDG